MQKPGSLEATSASKTILSYYSNTSTKVWWAGNKMKWREAMFCSLPGDLSSSCGEGHTSLKAWHQTPNKSNEAKLNFRIWEDMFTWLLLFSDNIRELRHQKDAADLSTKSCTVQINNANFPLSSTSKHGFELINQYLTNMQLCSLCLLLCRPRASSMFK